MYKILLSTNVLIKKVFHYEKQKISRRHEYTFRSPGMVTQKLLELLKYYKKTFRVQLLSSLEKKKKKVLKKILGGS